MVNPDVKSGAPTVASELLKIGSETKIKYRFVPPHGIEPWSIA